MHYYRRRIRYCMRRPDGRLVIGGRHESGRTDDDSVGNAEAAGHMKDWLRQLLANFGAPLNLT
jgi:glycine/D-amino acid oxidase-like deaminating enzyme